MAGRERYWHTKDYYKELEIPRTATQAEIKKAYRKLALQWHPDKNSSEEATEKFKALAESFEVLRDTALRRRYDSHVRVHGVQPQQSHNQSSGGGAHHAQPAAADPAHAAFAEEMNQKFGGSFSYSRAEDIFKNFFGNDAEFSSSHVASSSSGAVSDSPVVSTSSSSTTSVDEHGRSVTVKVTRITRADGTVEEKKEFEACETPQQQQQQSHVAHDPHNHAAIHAAAMAQHHQHMQAHHHQVHQQALVHQQAMAQHHAAIAAQHQHHHALHNHHH